MTTELNKIRKSVVKIFTQSDAPDYEQPWQMQGVVSSVGSGMIVQTQRGPRVLTNAHVVENQVFVEVRRYTSPTKFVAEVEGVGHECDLALLNVPEAGFFERSVPIPLGELPNLGEQVTVLGYPIGGDRLSLTQGIVSRIEMASYAQSQRRLLSVQIDASINDGNSGGPVVDAGGSVVGVAFQALDDADNIGYMIGSPVVRHFLEDMENGVIDGFPDLGVTTQSLESAAHRRSLGLVGNQTGGVLVSGVVHQGSAWGVLKRGDVLLKLGKKRVASDCSVRYRGSERIHYSYLIAQRHVGESLDVSFWRDGELQTAEITLRPPQYLVSEDRYDVKPTYFIYGGLLFVPLSRDYLKTWGAEWWSNAPPRLITIYEEEIRTSGRHEVVMLQKVLSHHVNQGYHELDSEVVIRAQGKKVRHMQHLVEILEKTEEEFVRFDLKDGRAIVLDRAAVQKRAPSILENFSIARDRSADLDDEPPARVQGIAAS